jgi:hypothetical protein
VRQARVDEFASGVTQADVRRADADLEDVARRLPVDDERIGRMIEGAKALYPATPAARLEYARPVGKGQPCEADGAARGVRAEVAQLFVALRNAWRRSWVAKAAMVTLALALFAGRDVAGATLPLVWSAGQRVVRWLAGGPAPVVEAARPAAPPARRPATAPVAPRLLDQKQSARYVTFPDDVPLKARVLFGLPQIEISLELHNPTPARITLSDWVVMMRPSNNRYLKFDTQLDLEAARRDGSVLGDPPTLCPAAPVSLEPGESKTVTLQLLADRRGTFAELYRKVHRETRGLPGGQDPDPKRPVLSEALSRELADAAARNFVWTESYYDVHVNANVKAADAVDPVALSRFRKFNLTRADVAGLKGATEQDYQCGIGAVPRWYFYRTGAAAVRRLTST